MSTNTVAQTAYPPRLRVAIDARYVQDYFPGIGRYTYSLIAALAVLPDGPHLTVIYNPALPDARYDLPGLVKQYPDRLELLTTNARPFSPGEQWQLFGPARHGRFDLWHAPYYIRPYLLPLPSVLTAYDVTAARFPDLLPSRKTRLAFSITTRLAFLASRRILTISQAAAQDIQTIYRVKPARLSVTPLGVGANFRPLTEAEKAQTRTALNLPDRYLLYVGINKPHKNLARLLEAFKLYRESSGDNLPLIIAGRPDPRYTEDLQRYATRLNLVDYVRFWGAVEETDLPKLYACASLFCFPSLYEGFGLPVLEAMACGTPAICADNSSLPEVAGDAAILFRAENVAGMADAIQTGLARGPELSKRGLTQAHSFSWERTARQTLEAYRKALIRHLE